MGDEPDYDQPIDNDETPTEDQEDKDGAVSDG